MRINRAGDGGVNALTSQNPTSWPDLQILFTGDRGMNFRLRRRRVSRVRHVFRVRHAYRKPINQL